MLCLGWTEQKKVHLLSHYCLLKHAVLLEPYVCFLLCLAFAVCVLLTNCIWFCVQLFYSVFKVLPRVSIEISAHRSTRLAAVSYIEVRVNLRQAIRSDGRESI